MIDSVNVIIENENFKINKRTGLIRQMVIIILLTIAIQISLSIQDKLKLVMPSERVFFIQIGLLVNLCFISLNLIVNIVLVYFLFSKDQKYILKFNSLNDWIFIETSIFLLAQIFIILLEDVLDLIMNFEMWVKYLLVDLLYVIAKYMMRVRISDMEDRIEGNDNLINDSFINPRALSNIYDGYKNNAQRIFNDFNSHQISSMNNIDDFSSFNFMINKTIESPLERYSSKFDKNYTSQL